MDPEQPKPSPAQLAARQDRLEQRIAELSERLDRLDSTVNRRNHLDPLAPLFPPPIAPALLSTPLPPPLEQLASTPYTPAAPDLLVKPLHPHPSLESRLGSQVFNRIGIVALLIGATWFLKLAVDNHWIGPTGRVLIGLLSGAGLVLWSERFRRSGFPAFSYSLKAIGTGVLYLTLWASFQLFHLLPASAALVAMLLVTAWNAYMAWSQDAELLAAYALAGGLSTPLLLSTGGNHEIFLFTYVLANDLACVVLARLKSWPRLLAAALPATVAYFIGWYSSFYTPSGLIPTAIFLLLFAAVFTAASLQRPRTKVDSSRTREIIQHILLPIGAAAFLSLGLYSALQDSGHHDLLPWLMLVLSAAYLGLMRLPQAAVTSAIHLSLAVVFLTIAIPLKASGSWIVIAWLVEGAALLWVSTRSAVAPSQGRSPIAPTLLILSSASLLLGFGGTIFDLFLSGIFTIRQAFFNADFGTALAALASFAISISIAQRASAPASAPTREVFWFRQLAGMLTIAFNLTAILAVVAQINLLFSNRSSSTEAMLQHALAVSAFLMLYGALLLALGFWRRIAFIRWQALVLLVFTIAKTFLYDISSLSQGYRVLSFIGLGAILMAVSFAYQKDLLGLRDPVPALDTHEGTQQ